MKGKIMSERPPLEKGINPDEFLQYYYLKEELTEFCRELGLQTSGGKIEITERIAHYLRTGEKLCIKSNRSLASDYSRQSYIGGHSFITLDTVIEGNFKCSEQHRAFFKSVIGKGFTFNVAFQKWLKENTGKTYRDAVEAYKEIKENQKNNRTVIDRQFEYNTYIRDFYDDPVNKGVPLHVAIACWKYKKSIPGANNYEREDLKSMESHQSANKRSER